jgi:hypothetical protein
MTRAQVGFLFITVFLICFLAPANFGFGLNLQIRIANAESEADRLQQCAAAAEHPNIQPDICPAIAHIRDVYDGMRLSELKSFFEYHLFIDKIKFALAGVLVAFAFQFLCGLGALRRLRSKFGFMP